MKNIEESLVKNTVIIFISKFFTQFLNIILLPILTASLSTEEYGTFDLISVYAWIVVPFLTMKLENGIFRFLIEKRDNEDDMKAVITNGLVSILFCFIIFSIIYFILDYFIVYEYIIYIYLYAISTLIFNVPLQISRGLGDNLTYAKASFIYSIMNILLCFILVYVLKLGLIGMIISGISAYSISGVYIIIKKQIFKFINFKYLNIKQSKDLINYSAPLVPNDLSSWILSISDRTMLSIFFDNGVTGIYSVSAKFPNLLSHVYSVFNLSWTESASINSDVNEKEKIFSDIIKKIFQICSGLCLLVLAAMPIAFDILIDESFSLAYKYIPILILGSMFEIYSGLLGAIYISMKKSRNIAISTLVAGIINIIINLLFMRKYGIIVACLSTVISYFVLSFYRCINLRKYIKLKYLYKSYILIMVAFVVLTILYYLKNYIVCIFATLVTMVIVVLINRESIVPFIRRIKKKFIKHE